MLQRQLTDSISALRDATGRYPILSFVVGRDPTFGHTADAEPTDRPAAHFVEAAER